MIEIGDLLSVKSNTRLNQRVDRALIDDSEEIDIRSTDSSTVDPGTELIKVIYVLRRIARRVDVSVRRLYLVNMHFGESTIGWHDQFCPLLESYRFIQWTNCLVDAVPWTCKTQEFRTSRTTKRSIALSPFTDALFHGYNDQNCEMLIRDKFPPEKSVTTRIVSERGYRVPLVRPVGEGFLATPWPIEFTRDGPFVRVETPADYAMVHAHWHDIAML